MSENSDPRMSKPRKKKLQSLKTISCNKKSVVESDSEFPIEMVENLDSVKDRSNSKKSESSKRMSPNKKVMEFNENGKYDRKTKESVTTSIKGRASGNGYVPSPRHQLQLKNGHNQSNSNLFHPVLDRLRRENNLNPEIFCLPYMENARYFIIKSEGEFDIYCSLKYSIWTSTLHGNKVLNEAFYEQARQQKGPVYLIYSVTGSKHFYGMAQMMSPLDYNASLQVWAVDNSWKGQFKVKWMYVKDIPSYLLEHILLKNNENKPVTHSRDAQEVLPDAAEKVIEVIHHFKHKTIIFDDFDYYEKKEREFQEERVKRQARI